MPWDTMTEDQLEYWRTYARGLANAVGLKDWMITIHDDPLDDDDDTAASIFCPFGMRQGNIRLGVNFNEHSLEDQRHYLVHELVHCHFDGTLHVLTSVKSLVGDGAHSVLHAAYLVHVEHGVDATARVLMRHLPLPKPPWVDPGP